MLAQTHKSWISYESSVLQQKSEVIIEHKHLVSITQQQLAQLWAILHHIMLLSTCFQNIVTDIRHSLLSD